ncbi:MAG TPA: hypothetical protein VE547_11820, partial [Mycobacteriales bacterium]|nr:hypothetical protein [Mycobacteriales bacterium]
MAAGPARGRADRAGARRLGGARRGRLGVPVLGAGADRRRLGPVVHFRAYRADRSTDDVSIYWSPDTGAHPVHGDIRARWAQLGWEESYLGFPVTA